MRWTGGICGIGRYRPKQVRKVGFYMKVNVVWNGEKRFTGTGEAGHTVHMDSQGAGTKPTELLLMALAGCSGIDVAMILTKMRRNIESLNIEVDADRRETDPKAFTAYRVTFRIVGDATPQQVERAVRLSFETYCSVSNSLKGPITFAYELNGTRYPETGYLE